jgi:hypothetical protein
LQNQNRRAFFHHIARAHLEAVGHELARRHGLLRCAPSGAITSKAASAITNFIFASVVLRQLAHALVW